MRILVLSRYSRLGASSRLRIYQYLPSLESDGFCTIVEPLLGDEYLNNLYHGRRKSLPYITKAYIKRLLLLLCAESYDLVWLEKEFLPWIPAWVELSLLSSKARLVVDYDDAIFHQYDRHSSAIVRFLLAKKIDRVIRRADLVVVGNTYLARRAREAGAKHVEIVPTVVDVSHYSVSRETLEDTVTIGWIGSPATAHNLYLIEQVLIALASQKNVRFFAVGANPLQLSNLPITVLPWSEAQEVEQIQQFDIGIMPLPDKPFERGKCGYKLIQCMACGKPVVASPVGANKEIVRDGIDGFLADSFDEWAGALTRLIDNPALRLRMGEAGRRRVESLYSLQVAAPRMKLLLHSMEAMVR